MTQAADEFVEKTQGDEPQVDGAAIARKIISAFLAIFRLPVVL